ncbi:MAG: hypothetical protein ABMB14_15395 [Myxococcota bacterium]
MPLWKRLFDADGIQRQDIDAALTGVDAATERILRLRAELDRANQRIARLEEVVGGLCGWLEANSGLDRGALAATVAGRGPPELGQVACASCGRSFDPAVLLASDDGAVCVGCHLSG